MTIGKMILSALMASACAGCVSSLSSGPSKRYEDTDSDFFGRSSRMEYTQMHRAVTISIERMLTDPMFTGNYNAARGRAMTGGRTLPTISINPIENNSGDGRSDSEATGQLYRELLTAIRKTGRFEMIDRMRRKQMGDANIAGVNEGESSSAIQGVGSYTSADFVMTGELRRQVTEGDSRTAYHHILNLELIDSLSGTVFWSDSIVVAKSESH